jgi:hypothetical protein
MPSLPWVVTTMSDLPVSTSTAREAVAEAREWARKSRNGATPFPGLCLQHVRMDWDLPAVFPTAISAWENAHHKHRFIGSSLARWEDEIPFGAPVFSDSPKDDAGHVFIAGGRFQHGENKGRRIFRSNDVVTHGGISAVTLDFFVERWGHKILGWTHDLNGFWLPMGDRD